MQGLIGFLPYGAMGLGLALAWLAYQLLRYEQARSKPRASFLIAIYVFMTFSLTSVVFGYVSEHFKPDVSENRTLHSQLLEKTQEVEDLKARINSVDKTLNLVRGKIRSLMDAKEVAVNQLSNLQLPQDAKEEVIHIIQTNLQALDEQVRKAVNEGGLTHLEAPELSGASEMQ